MEQKSRIIPEEKFKELYDAACSAAKNSYSPYSHFPVGAALLMEDGSIIKGANIVALVIVTPASDYPVGPCGACRQVLTEFAPGETPVWFGPKWENMVKTTLGELYPYDSLHELAST